MKILRAITLPLLLAAALPAAEKTPLYRDPSQPIEARVKDLLGRMTLEEKLGQINMPCAYLDQMLPQPRAVKRRRAWEEGTLLKVADEAEVAACREGCRLFVRGAHPSFKRLGPGGGFFTLANRTLPVAPREMARFTNELQRMAVGETRLGHPAAQRGGGNARVHGRQCHHLPRRPFPRRHLERRTSCARCTPRR